MQGDAVRSEPHMNDFERAAFERLLGVAKSDSGQCRIVANFILAWWNAGSLVGFDLARSVLARPRDFIGYGDDRRLPVSQQRGVLSQRVPQRY